MPNVTARWLGANMICIDYFQRLSVTGDWPDKRSALNHCLDTFRRWATAERSLVVVSSVGRQRTGPHGRSSYDNLNMASFKETGELEYASDDIYMLNAGQKGEGQQVCLSHLGSREAEEVDIHLIRSLSFMEYTKAEFEEETEEGAEAEEAAP
jgi:hypothetical protein